jgi:hypothetical protein
MFVMERKKKRGSGKDGRWVFDGANGNAASCLVAEAVSRAEKQQTLGPKQLAQFKEKAD